tara:strand:+ start:2440 stop:3150 length:711 start_codon:yes stop_codon:yes gene_type:complete
MIIACWSGPRNISTALMRSWSSRDDTFVIDEPFYAYYLNKTKLKHPMSNEIINHYSCNYDKIVENLLGKIPDGKKIYYQKHMAHHLVDVSKIEWIKKCENCILIRHPKEVIHSYKAKNSLSYIEELGYPQQYAIIQLLKKANKSFIVIESSELLENPKKVLINWCKKIDIKFNISMLNWEKGNHDNDGIWWKHWYDNVIKSTGFQKNSKKDITIENKYDSIYNESMKYYKYFQKFK